jgi:ribosomal protein S7
VLELLEKPGKEIRKAVGFNKLNLVKKTRAYFAAARRDKRWLKSLRRQIRLNKITKAGISWEIKKKIYYAWQHEKTKSKKTLLLRAYKLKFLRKLRKLSLKNGMYGRVAVAGQLHKRKGHQYLLGQKRNVLRRLQNRSTFCKKKSFDGKFHSRVLNKMVGVFTKDGKRRKAAKHVYTAVLILSYIYNISPVLLLDQSVVKNLPPFLLKKYIVRRTQVKQYPVLARKEKKIKTTIKWVCDLVKKKTNLDSKKDHFYLNIFSALDSIVYSDRGSQLLSMFRSCTKSAVQNARNVRFNWRKLNRYRGRVRRKKKI